MVHVVAGSVDPPKLGVVPAPQVLQEVAQVLLVLEVGQADVLAQVRVGAAAWCGRKRKEVPISVVVVVDRPILSILNYALK